VTAILLREAPAVPLDHPQAGVTPSSIGGEEVLSMVRQTPRSISIHEAGHAVTGRVLGLEGCEGASVVRNKAESEAGYAILGDPLETIGKWEREYFEELDRTGVRPVRYRGLNHRAAIRARIMAEMAGAEAEKVLVGYCQGGDGFDRRQIEQWREMDDAELSDDLWQRHEPRMRRQTQRLIRKHRDKIERVAASLRRKKTLTGEEIDSLIAQSP
jgi:ATP-dependent Zn protease